MVESTTAAIWEHLSSDLWRFIRRRVPDDHTADDLLQESFVRVHRNIGTLQEADRVAAWVYQIARNVVHDHHRRTALPTAPFNDAENASSDDPGPSAGCQDTRWLDKMIQSLPDGYREAVHLAEIEEQSQLDVAERLGLSLSGAKSRVQRGRAMLKEILLQCCSFELDSRGRVMGCDPKPNQQTCQDCGDPTA